MIKERLGKQRKEKIKRKADNLFEFHTHLSKQFDQFNEIGMAGHQEVGTYKEKERMLARKNVVMEARRKVPFRLLSSSLTAKVSVLL